MLPKNVWNRIPHLIQQDNTLKKGETDLAALLITKKNK